MVFYFLFRFDDSQIIIHQPFIYHFIQQYLEIPDFFIRF